MALKSNCLACNVPVKNTDTDGGINEVAYHKKCTRCHGCTSALWDKMPCLFYKGKLYCDATCVQDAPHELRCHKCMKILAGRDIVRKIENQYYHTPCFRCYTCNKMIITGQRYQIERNRIFCAAHMKQIAVPKRRSFNRTIINNVQRQILQTYFEKDKFPSMLDIMDICIKTDLPHDVVKHWFQNNRARKSK